MLKDPIIVWCDSKSCIVIAKNYVLHGRTKQIDIKFHFIQELVAENTIKLTFCNIDEQFVNVFTKNLIDKKHCKLKDQMGVCGLQSRGNMLE